MLTARRFRMKINRREKEIMMKLRASLLPFNHRVVEPPNNAGFVGYHCELHQKRVFVKRLQPNGN
jgi:hypothetical protein